MNMLKPPMKSGYSKARSAFLDDDEYDEQASEEGGPGSTKHTPNRQEMIRLKEEQTERAMQNFKQRGGMVQDVLNKSRSSKVSLRGGNAELSADSDVEAYVKMGVQNAFTVADKVIQESYLPYAVSFLLSLSQDQLTHLQER